MNVNTLRISEEVLKEALQMPKEWKIFSIEYSPAYGCFRLLISGTDIKEDEIMGEVTRETIHRDTVKWMPLPSNK